MIRAAQVRERLRSEQEVALARFTSEELVAVGAHSPIEGLDVSERLNEMGPVPLTAALATALRGLVARGLAHPPGSEEDGEPLLEAPEPEEAEEETDTVPVPISGDLALVVALRRDPALVGLLRTPQAADLASLGLSLPRRTEVVLHGFVSEEGQLAGFLEERRSALGIHRFVLRTLAREAEALVEWLAGWPGTHGSPLDAGAEEWEADLELCAPGREERPGERARLLLTVAAGEAGDAEARLEAPGVAPDRLPRPELAARLAATVLETWRELTGGSPTAA